MNIVDNANKILYYSELYRLNHYRVKNDVNKTNILSTYAKTATSKLSKRMLMNNIWNANKTWVAVASAAPPPSVSVSLFIRSRNSNEINVYLGWVQKLIPSSKSLSVNSPYINQ